MSEPLPIGVTQTIQMLQKINGIFEKAALPARNPDSLDSVAPAQSEHTNEERTKSNDEQDN